MISTSDLPEFSRLPLDHQQDIRRWLDIFAQCRTAKDLERFTAAKKGFSLGSLRLKWYSFQAGGWRALINKAVLPKDDSLPADFIAWWTDMVSASGRNAATDRLANKRAAYRRFLDQWRNGAEIPGVGRWQDWHRRECGGVTPPTMPWDALTHPPKLSYRNLARIVVPKTQRAARQDGTAAVRKLVAGIPMDMGSLRFGEVFCFDDARLDFKVIDQKTGQVCCLNMLVAYDLATRKVVQFVVWPALERDDGSHVGIARKHMLHLAAQILQRYGLPTGYQCKWLVENASATFSEENRSIISMISGGMIEVSNTSIVDARSLLGGWNARAGGNPNGKAWLESLFNLAWNELAWEPGQQGRNWLHRPGSLWGREKEAAQIIRAGQMLPLEVQEALTSGYFLKVSDAMEVVGSMWERLANRLDHNLQGFEQIWEWRWRGQSEWSPVYLSPLPALPADALKQAVETRNRLETPNERAARLLQRDGYQFAPCPPEALAYLAQDKAPLTYQGSGVLMLKRKGEDTLLFDVARMGLQEGCKYVVSFDAMRREEIYIMTQRGEFVGAAKRQERIGYLDQAALRQATEAAQRRVKEAMKAANARQSAKDLAARLDQLEYQEQVFNDLASRPAIVAPLESGIPQPTGAPVALPAPRAERPAAPTASEAALNAARTLKAQPAADLGGVDEISFD